MDRDALREIWEEFCFYLSDDISTNITENVFEQIVLAQFEKLLGWSKFKGEIKVKPSLPIGRQNSIIPDIVICTPGNRPAVVLEIKRPAEDLSRPGNLGQLQSYMRQTKADFGLLVGKEIHVYYDGSLSPNRDPVCLSKIHFKSDSPEGINFVDIFNRTNFIQKKYESYLRSSIDNLERDKKIDVLKEKLQSEETRHKILGFIQYEFGNVEAQILREAMNGLTIRVFYENGTKESESTTFKGPQETVFVCKNKNSGKYFIYIEDRMNDNDILLINPDGVLKILNADLFGEPKEETKDYLLSYQLVTEKQLEKYDEYEAQQDEEQTESELTSHGIKRIKKPRPVSTSAGGKKRSPSAYEWSKEVPELSRLSGRVSWRAICDYLKIPVGVDSARRVLKDWARENRRDWPPVPEPEP